MSVLPPPQALEVTRRARLSERLAATLDAVLVMVPEDAEAALLAALPESARWRTLIERARPSAGSVRVSALANARQFRGP